MPSGIKIDNVSRTIFIKSATNILSAFLPMKKYTVGVPFNTKVLKQIMEDFAPGYSNDDLLALYTLTGGVPKYVELFCDNQALSVDRIYDFVFSENSLFIDEGRNLLITEFGKNYGIYFSILLEIANGHYTQGEIESALGGISIGGHLSKLENVFNLF